MRGVAAALGRFLPVVALTDGSRNAVACAANQPRSATASSSMKATSSPRAARAPVLRARLRPTLGSTIQRAPSRSASLLTFSSPDVLSTTITSYRGYSRSQSAARHCWRFADLWRVQTTTEQNGCSLMRRRTEMTDPDRRRRIASLNARTSVVTVSLLRREPRGQGDEGHGGAVTIIGSELLSRLKARIPLEARKSTRARFERLNRPRWGNLRRFEPFSSYYGFERGTPIDRFYIERFLAERAVDIRGRVLEVGHARYARAFSSPREVDIVDIDPTNTDATIVADLSERDSLPEERFDCFILTQTLQYIYDVQAAIEHVHRVLAPGGTVLCTLPSTSRIARRCLEAEYWRFTVASARSLFAASFGKENVRVEPNGSVLTSIAFLAGMAAEELSEQELESTDPFFPLLITVRAQR
jgi:SAM-dependent methyltransferase